MIAPTHFAASPANVPADDEGFALPNSSPHRVIISKCDAERVMVHRWWVDSADKKLKFYTKIGRQKVYLSRFIMNAKPGVQVDHISCDRLDNRRSNLRFARHVDNCRNRRKALAGATSRFKGVSRKNDRQRCWHASIRADGKSIMLGYFFNEDEAARAYDDAARLAFGAFGRFNFPLPGEQPALSPTGGC